MPKESLYRLSDSAAVEPLVNRWAAWSHLISPVACSLHLRNYQLGILRSYIDDPQTHVLACQDPQMRSGRFVEIPAERAAEVRDFLISTEVKQRDNLRLADKTIEFHNYLLEEAKGQSLDLYYEKAPPELRGYVELIYDYYNRPTVRFYESLLYESHYYDKGLQSLRLFRQTNDNARPFFMNTPRLPDEGQIDWTIPFESPEIDELFKLDFSPQPLGFIRELMGIKPGDDQRLLPLLSEGRIPKTEKWEGSDVRVRYFGHACLLIEWKGKSILTDPCLGVVPSDGGIERLTYKDLPERIDFALVTHNHHDHFCLESLLRLRHRIECLIVPRSFGIAYGDISLRLLARKVGFRNVVEVDALDSIQLPDGEIVAIPFMGEHADLPHGKTAYVIRCGGEQMLFAADSDCLDGQMYERLRGVIGPIETVFIGMECVGAPLTWSCGSFLPAQPDFHIEQSRRYKGADSERALKILERVGAERLYIYAMGMEPWLEHLLGLAYSPDAVQLKEASKLLQKVCEMGFSDAELLSGTRDIRLSPLPHKRNVHARPRGPGGEAATARSPVTRSDGELKTAPLSFVQRQLWNSVAPDVSSAGYNLSASLRLSGALNVGALEQSLNEIIRRHEILRSTFASVHDGAVQIIGPALKLCLPMVDLAGLSGSRSQTEGHRVVEEMNRRFDLSSGPLIRFTVLRFNEQDHLLLLSTHQIVCDRWSIDVLVKELASLYAAFSAGKPSPLVNQPIQYAAPVARQREWAQGKDSTEHISYWKQHLASDQWRLDLPTDRPRSDAQTYEGRIDSFALPKTLAEALEALSRREGVSLFATLLAAFQSLLHRYTGQDDIIVGSVFANRHHPDTETGVGCYMNTLALRGNLANNIRFTQLLGQVQEVIVGAQAHQDIPFEIVIDSLRAEAQQSDTPFVQVGFVFDQTRRQPLELPALTWSPVNIDMGTAPFDLALLVNQAGREITVGFSYNAALFDHSTIAEIAKDFILFLDGISAHPESRVLDIPLTQEAHVNADHKTPAVEANTEAEDQFVFD